MLFQVTFTLQRLIAFVTCICMIWTKMLFRVAVTLWSVTAFVTWRFMTWIIVLFQVMFILLSIIAFVTCIFMICSDMIFQVAFLLQHVVAFVTETCRPVGISKFDSKNVGEIHDILAVEWNFFSKFPVLKFSCWIWRTKQVTWSSARVYCQFLYYIHVSAICMDALYFYGFNHFSRYIIRK